LGLEPPKEKKKKGGGDFVKREVIQKGEKRQRTRVG